MERELRLGIGSHEVVEPDFLVVERLLNFDLVLFEGGCLPSLDLCIRNQLAAGHRLQVGIKNGIGLFANQIT